MAVFFRRGFPALFPLLPCAFAAAQAVPQAPATSAAIPAVPGAPVSTSATTASATRTITAKDRQHALHQYQQGMSQLREQHFEEAARNFGDALRLDPTRPEYYQGWTLAREARVNGLLHEATRTRDQHPLQAERLMAEARGIDPENPSLKQHEISGTAVVHPGGAFARQRFLPAGAIELQPNKALHSFHGQSDTRALANAIGAAYSLRVAIDPDLKSKPLRLELDNVDYTAAVDIFNMAAGTFVTPLDEHTMLIAEDTTANRVRLEHLLEEVVPLPGYTVEQINETATLVRTVFGLKQVSVAPQLGALTIRAPEDTMNAIDTVLADLLDSSSEVTVDVKLYSIDTQKVRNLGIVLPTSFTLFSVASEVQKVLSANASLIQQLVASGALPSTASSAEIAAYLVFVAGLSSTSALQNTFFIFGGGLSSLTSNTNTSLKITPVGIATSSFPSLNFALNVSDARRLDDLQLRIADRATGIFKAGMRYPIQTSIYSDIASGTTTSNTLQALIAKYLGTTSSTLSSTSTIPQFQYEDIGLTVNATPRVISSTEISLKLDIKLSALAGTTLNGIPVLANRQFVSTVTLQDGETAVMASHLLDSEAAAVSGVPGLTGLPGLGNLTNRQTNDSRTNLVLAVTPHIVRRSHELAKGPYVPLQPRPDD